MTRTEFKTRKGFVVGVDLGQSRDFTAISVIERIDHVIEDSEKGSSTTKLLHLRHLQRLKLGTSYPDQVSTIGKLISSLPNNTGAPKAALIVDATGVGKPVVDLMKKSGLRPIAVTITGGKEVTRGGDFAFGVPKRNLVSALLVALQSGRLKVAQGLAEAETFVQELLNFKVKISTGGHEGYAGDWRDGINDDLVLSVALANWFCERERPKNKLLNFSPLMVR